MTKKRRSLLLVALSTALAMVLASTGCDRNVGTIDLFFLTPDDTGVDPFASIDSLFIRIGIGGESTYREDLVHIPGDEVTLPEILVGESWIVSVQGESVGGAPVSRGRSLPFKVHEGQNRLDLFVATLSERGGLADASEAIIPGTARGGHTAVELVDGRVLLIGGASSINGLEVQDPVQAVDIFDPTTGRLIDAGQCSPDAPPGSIPLCLLSPRLHAAIGRTSNGDVLVVGGENEDAVVTSVERLPRGGSSFVAVEKALTRFDASLVQTDFGALLLGGVSGEGTDESYFTRSAVRFDERGEYETEYEGILRRGRQEAAVATVSAHGGQIFVFSGYGYEATELGLLPSYEVISLSPVSGVSDPLELGDLAPTGYGEIAPRAGAVATAIDDRFVLVTGGIDEFGLMSDEIDLFDGGNGYFCRIGAMASARYLHAAAPLHDGSVLVVGGLGNQVEIIDLRTALGRMRDELDCDRLGGGDLDPLVHIDSNIAPLEQRRTLPTVTALANDMVLIAGGFDADGNAVGQHLLWVQ